MDVSVIICTYNRCASLRRVLESFCAANIPKERSWELVLVDNRSTDATKEICEAFQHRLPIKYLFEPQQGKSRALNKGLSAVAGELILFTDDDVTVQVDWISSYVAAAQRFPKVDLFGGRIIPQWETKPPHWLVTFGNGDFLSGLAVYYDLGNEEAVYSSMTIPFLGANMAIRKQLLQSGLRFREDIGLSGSDPTRGEDTVFVNQALEMGCKAAYIPGSVVWHWNPTSRATHRYLIEWYAGIGRRDVRLGVYPPSRKMMFGAPLYLWRLFAIQVAKLILTRWTAPLRTWLNTETKAARYWGTLMEHREMYLKRKHSGVKG